MKLPIPISFEFFPPNTPVGSEKLKTVARISAMPASVLPTQLRCGAASWPRAAMSRTVASVFSRVEPPAP